jgi:hypothetical protein
MRKSHCLIVSLLLMIGFTAQTAEAADWSLRVVNPPNCDCTGGWLGVWATHNCQVVPPPTYGAPNWDDPGAEYVFYDAPPVKGPIPWEWMEFEVNDLLVVFLCAPFPGAPPCECPPAAVKFVAPDWDDGSQQWVLLNLVKWLEIDAPPMNEIPKLVPPGGMGGGLELFILINLREWVAGGMPPALSEYQIVDGESPDLPGYLIGTTPITFDPSDPEGPFGTLPYNGQVYNHGGIGFPPPCPCDCEDPSDGTVDVGDFLALLASWGGPGPCDCEDPPDGIVDVGDFLAILSGWGLCP